jgi:hypothetical protein
MFWRDPVDRLKELRDMLRPAGVIAIVRQPRGPGSRRVAPSEIAAELKGMLAEAGYSHIRTETLALKPAAVCALGRKEA